MSALEDIDTENIYRSKSKFRQKFQKASPKTLQCCLSEENFLIISLILILLAESARVVSICDFSKKLIEIHSSVNLKMI